jgi:hypothetical protein
LKPSFLTLTSSSGITVRMDITRDFSVQKNSELTKFPIEDGSKRTDHITVDPIEITFSSVLSSSNLYTKDVLDAKERVDALFSIIDAKETVTISYGNEIYPGMVIKNFTCKMNGDSYNVDFSFSELVTTTFIQVDLPVNFQKKSRSGSNKGRQDALEAGSLYDQASQNAAAKKAESPKEEEKKGSTLHNLFS